MFNSNRSIMFLTLVAVLIFGLSQPVSAQTVTTYMLSGTVVDETAGWGVYARLDIPGYGSVFTNPTDGTYAVGLPAGTYEISVTGLWPGYVAITDTVIVGSNMTRGFYLAIDNGVCSGPGYVAGGFTENFDSVTAPALPDGWVVKRVKKKGGAVWATATSTFRPAGNAPYSPSNLVSFNASQLASNNVLRLYRYRPVDLTATTNYNLTLWMFHDPNSRGDTLQVQVSTDGGAIWANVGAAISRTGTLGWAQHTVSLAAYSSSTNLLIGLNARSGGGQSGVSDIYIDSVSFGSPTNCQPLSGGGLVIGHVLDANTGLGLNDGFVSGHGVLITGGTYETLTFPTPADPNRPDGFFALFQPEGISTLDASSLSYGSQTKTATVASRQVTQLASNFLLQAGQMTVIGSPVTMNLGGGGTGTRSITIRNTGGLPATFSLTESASWLLLTPLPTDATLTAGSSQAITLNFNAAGMAPGIYTTEIVFNDDTPYLTESIPVTLVVSLPAAYNDAYTVNEDQILTVAAAGVLANDTNPLPGTLEAVLESAPTHGDLALNADGSFIYTPEANFAGTDTFAYHAAAGVSSSNVASVTLKVTQVNDAPVARADFFGTDEEVSVTGLILANDSDVDGDPLSVLGVGTPSHGTVDLNPDFTVTYTPAPDTYGPDSFTYTLSDGQGGTATGTVSITVNPVNDAPVCQVMTLDVEEDTLDTTAPDCSDPDNDLLAYAIASQPTYGTAAVVGGQLQYTPALNYNGPDSFTYTANDGTVDSAAALVTVGVTSVNDAPVCQAVALNTEEDTLGTALPDCSDVENDQLTYTISTQPAQGSASEVSGEFHYTPDLNDNGLDSFTYRAYDGVDSSSQMSVAVTILAINDVPSFTAGTDQMVNEDAGAQTATGWATALSAGPADESGQTLDFLVSNDNNALFSVQPAVSPAGDLTYTPAENANGSATVSVRIHDNGGTVDGGVDTSASQAFTITVGAVNDAPSFTAGSDQSVSEDAGAQTETGWATVLSAGPVDESGQSLNFLVSNDNNALFSAQPEVSASGELTYSPAGNAHGFATVTVRIHDDGGSADGGVDTSAAQTFTITVTPVNDAPVCQNVTLNTDEDTVGATAPNCADVDGDILTYAVSSQPAYGAAAVVLDLLQYTPNPNYNGPDGFTYTANDGTANSAPAAVTVSVGSANDLPTAGNDTAATDEDTAVSIDLLANDGDTDGGTLSVVSVTTPAHGTVVIGKNQVTYTPSLNYNGQDTFTYTLSDGQGGTAEALVTVTVAPVNDAPVGEADAYETVFMSPLTVSPASLLINDNDVDGDALSVVLEDSVSHGTLILNPDKSFTYTPNVGYFGPDSFTYRASDGTLQSQKITVSITVKVFNIFLPLVRR